MSRAKIKDRLMTGIFYAIGWIMLAFLLYLMLTIIFDGLKGFQWDFLGAAGNGIFNQFFNTIYLVFLSLLVSVPIGIGAGVYLAEYAKEGKFLTIFEISIESLSSLPSIVIGLFGYLAFIMWTGMSWNILAGALTISILSIPLITTETNNAIRSLPVEYKEGSLSLGATKSETIRKVLIPAAMPQILTGVIMAAGRGFGEAAALLYTSGQSTYINWQNFWKVISPSSPLNPFRSGETLALHIWAMRTEGALNPSATQIANFTSAVLVVLALLFTLVTRRISDKMRKRNNGGN